MKVGELFVQLDLKGAEKVGQSLAQVNKGVKDVGSSALAGQAQLQRLSEIALAAGAALGALTKHGAALGMSLRFSSLFTGQGIAPIQEMGRALGKTNEQAATLSETLTNTVADLAVNGYGGKQLLGILNLPPIDQRTTWQQYYTSLWRAAHSSHPGYSLGMVNKALEEAGLSPTDIEQIRNAKTPFANIPASQLITNREAAEATKISIAWNTLGQKLESLEVKFASIFGKPFIDALNKFADSALKLMAATEGFEQKHPNAQRAVSDVAKDLATITITGPGAAAAGSALGFLLGGPGGALAGAALGGTAGTVVGGVAAQSYFDPNSIKTALSYLPAALIGRLLREAGQKLDATINITVPPLAPVKQTHTYKQTHDLNSGKTSEVNRAYQARTQSAGS